MPLQISEDVFSNNIVPFILKYNITHINDEKQLLYNVFHIFKLICSCKHYSQYNNNDFWISIFHLIFPKNYSITSSSIHIKDTSYSSCGYLWVIEHMKKNNLNFNKYNTYRSRHDLWISEGCQCCNINHFNIETLETKDKYDTKQKRNFQKIIMIKLRMLIEQGFIISKKDCNKVQSLQNKLNISYNNYSKKSLQKFKTQLDILEKKINQKNTDLANLNYAINGTKIKKFNSFINFMNIQKQFPDYNFHKYKSIWNNMSKEAKNEYKTM